MVVYKHALRNMMVPLLTIIGIFVAIALTGTVLTETVFTRPGLGKMLVDSIGARDYPLAQGAITVFTMTIIVVEPGGRHALRLRRSPDRLPVGPRERPDGHRPSRRPVDLAVAGSAEVGAAARSASTCAGGCRSASARSWRWP